MKPPADGARAPQRVAVVAIHGVADQRAGDTARAIAALLANVREGQARYTQGPCDTFLVPVPVLPPMFQGPEATEATEEAMAGRARRVKAVHQALRSDFQRGDWRLPQHGEGTHPAAATAAQLLREDAGIAFTDYLLYKAWRNHSEDETYEATRIKLQRDPGAGGVREVDVHEMYWADLSRLSGAIPRIVTELFALLFRLSRLGRDTVDQAARAAGRETRSWRALASLQIGLDWAFSAILANLFLQLLLVGFVIGGLGGIRPALPTAALVLGLALPVLGAWWACYRVVQGFWSSAACIAGAAALACLLLRLPPVWVVGTAWFAVLALLCDYGLRVAEVRFPTTRPAGLLLGASTALLFFGHVAWFTLAQGDALFRVDDWLRAGMRTLEYLLLLLTVYWFVAGFALLAWVFTGELASRGGATARSSVATGRLGLFASLAVFVTIAMATWAMLTVVVELGAAGTAYEPLFFTDSSRLAVDGKAFVHARFEKSTGTFAVVGTLILALLAYLVGMVTPSVLAEFKADVGPARVLGRWLSGGYRHLDTFVALLVAASAIAAALIGMLLVLAPFVRIPGGAAIGNQVVALSNAMLKPLVFSTATVGGALTLFGGVLSKYMPGLRAPLDVALDVDNHFREFPRRAITRARIFARYVALLEQLAAQGYERVVIVSHSQGTIITTELLRYLQYRASKAGAGDRARTLWQALEGRVFLLTAGCPLRQLYAARFPVLYGWVLAGPTAADIGVRRWTNVFTSGDYVGRALWSWQRPDAFDGTGSPPAPGAKTADLCIGAGAHTHYFDPGQSLVARCIESLVTEAA
ncbi:hypothetical protein HHL11_31225 [Ramlibacter sp. G-1-2-2]|uniref:Uncharacterized protein n=1 Tax=Ramlibacter agri TaxID=2728837 RepID=A0A848HDL4_9BURK|nr:hypothetical protein [Ramlibacter agri]NML48262.1 hypothetical protein [Ramlibacter agri]